MKEEKTFICCIIMRVANTKINVFVYSCSHKWRLWFSEVWKYVLVFYSFATSSTWFVFPSGCSSSSMSSWPLFSFRLSSYEVLTSGILSCFYVNGGTLQSVLPIIFSSSLSKKIVKIFKLLHLLPCLTIGFVSMASSIYPFESW